MRIDLETRREKILRIIINTYIHTGNPVSSRTICTQYNLDLCPASVRNVMADLEERGFITHLHTSAGRVPTDKGYRFYVDKLIENVGLTHQERVFIDKGYLDRQSEIEEIIRKTSKILSEVTNYTGFVSFPQLRKSKFKHIRFIPVTSRKICMVLFTNTGIMKSAIISFDLNIDLERLKNIEDFMNTQLEGLPLTQLKTKLRSMMIEERHAFFQLLKQALELIDLGALVDEKARFYFEGVSNILNFPEFCDAESMLSLMQMVEEKMTLSELVKELAEDEPPAGKVRVYIGRENARSFLNKSALILTGYSIDNEPIGTLGIIGPKRMDYAKSIAAVEYVNKLLSEILSKLSF